MEQETSGGTAIDAVFLSDLHLKSVEERNGQTLLRFLVSLDAQSRPPMIFLLGDIFDLWVSGHRVFIDRFRPLLEVLERLSKKGARLVYFEGNHDLHLAPYWEKVLGADVRVGAGSFTVGGFRIRCEHGDEINREDAAYLRLRAFLRHPLLETAAHRLPGRFWDYLGQRASHTSRKYSSPERSSHEERLRNLIRSHAQRVWPDDPFDVVISGHMHVKDDWTFEVGGRSVRSINLGSWFGEPEVLVLAGGRLEWRKP